MKWYNENVKIGIFDPYLDTLGGGEKYMLTLAECLSTQHDVSVFWNDQSIKDTAEKRFSINLSKIQFVPNIFDSAIGLFRRLITTREYDLIIYLSDGSIPTVFSKKLFLHFQFPTEWVTHVPTKSKVKLIVTNAILCNSEFTKKYIEKLYGKECVVLYPPVDVDHAYSKVPKENIIVSVGRYTRPNGVEFKKHSILINNFKTLSKKEKQWEFHIFTNSLPQDKLYIDALIDSAKGYPITIHNDSKRETLFAYYKKAKVYWHAAGFGEDVENHPELAEHFGIVTVEAMNRGAVPIVFNAGGQKEIITNGRSGYLWNTEKDLLEKTEFLMTHEKYRLQLAKHAFEDSLQYDKKKFCKKIMSLV